MPSAQSTFRPTAPIGTRPEVSDGRGQVVGTVERLDDDAQLTQIVTPHELGALETAARGVDILMAGLETAALAADPPDVLIAPDLSDVGLLELGEDRADLFERGRLAAEAQAERLAALVG